MLTPTIQEPQITHALAASSAFNLKLCHNAVQCLAMQGSPMQMQCNAK